jgi:hypothetical protein
MLHNNACPHTAAYSTESLCQLNLVLKHFPCSPDLASSITHLVHSKTLFRGYHFASDYVMKEVVRHPTKNILFCGHTEVCGLLEKVC